MARGPLTFVLFLFSFSSLSPKALSTVDKKPVVFVRTVQPTELAEVLTYPARVEPRIKAAVVAEADGVVTRILAPLGRGVRAKEPLLVIRNTDPVYRYSPMTVVSPVSGVVSRVDVTEGSQVSRGDKLLLVTDPEQASVIVEVTAQDVRSIKPGMIAHMSTQMTSGATGGDEGSTLRVRGISPFVDPATGTASCELELVRRGAGRLPPPGVIGRVVFRANVRQGFSISESAITYRGKDPFIRVVNGDGKAKLVSVVLGRKQAGAVEILKGINRGDQLIERASGFVADGEAVEVQKAAAAAPEVSSEG